MRFETAPKVVGRSDIDIAVMELQEKTYHMVPLRYFVASGGTPTPKMRFRVACHPKPAGCRVAERMGFEPTRSF